MYKPGHSSSLGSQFHQIRHCTSFSPQQQTCQAWRKSDKGFLRYARNIQTDGDTSLYGLWIPFALNDSFVIWGGCVVTLLERWEEQSTFSFVRLCASHASEWKYSKNQKTGWLHPVSNEMLFVCQKPCLLGGALPHPPIPRFYKETQQFWNSSINLDVFWRSQLFTVAGLALRSHSHSQLSNC